MAQNGLTDSINRVLKLGRDYFTYYNLECQSVRIAEAQAAQGLKTDILQEILEVRGRCNQARHDLLEIIPVLTVQLEDADVDSSGLLMFRHRIDGGGGPAEAMKGWAALKVQLQRAAILLGDRGTLGFKLETPKERKAKWMAKAMLLVRDHPDWSDAKIAKQVGIDPSRLSGDRCPEYQRAALLARQRRLPKGFISTDPDTGDRTVEAIDTD